MIAFILAAAVSAVSVVSADPIVNTTLGAVRGYTTSTGVRVFKGIPFAAPPVGDLRWAPPAATAKWAPAVRDARAFAHNCIQATSAHNMGWPQPASTLSEDCLYLNVYAPSAAANNTSSSSPRPVMVWIYGGGYQGGGGNETRLNGTNDVALLEQARQRGDGEGLVIVTLNYRLGVFGFAAADALRGRDAAHGSTGNYGILDQRAALQWVAREIAAFGGDPSRVFIVGQSAGADSVSQHLVRPRSWGLFAAAGMESGAWADGWTTETVADRAPCFAALLHAAGCGDVACLVRDVPAWALHNASVDAAGKNSQMRCWWPSVDGVELTRPGALLARDGHLAPGVPVLVGSVAEDIDPFGVNCEGAACAASDLGRFAAGNVAPTVTRGPNGAAFGWNASDTAAFVRLYTGEPVRPGGDYTSSFWAERHAGADFWGGAAARRAARWVEAAGSDAFLYYWPVRMLQNTFSDRRRARCIAQLLEHSAQHQCSAI